MELRKPRFLLILTALLFTTVLSLSVRAGVSVESTYAGEWTEWQTITELGWSYQSAIIKTDKPMINPKNCNTTDYYTTAWNSQDAVLKNMMSMLTMAFTTKKQVKLFVYALNCEGRGTAGKVRPTVLAVQVKGD